MITPIDAASVDKITSGQVITSVASAIKELVENALDAGATVVDVRVVNHGRDSFSVQDNGSGIDPEDFPLVGAKHATSKLRTFADLGDVATLGFRGEALSSLCALAKVEISSSGYRVELGPDGSVLSKTRAPTPPGTLVQVSDLFRSLPVRRKDLERNHQREFARTASLLQEYAVICNARLTAQHIVNGRMSTVLQSQGATLQQRIACVWGASRINALMPIDLTLADDSRLVGYISQPVFGKGEPSTDRQLLYVNSRPSQQRRIAKAVTEVYKQYNVVENPFFVLDLKLPRNRIDVNVRPDKRAVLLHGEDRVIHGIRVALAELFDGIGHSVPRSQSAPVPPPKQKRQSTLLNKFKGSGELVLQTPGPNSDEESELDSTPLEHVSANQQCLQPLVSKEDNGNHIPKPSLHVESEEEEEEERDAKSTKNDTKSTVEGSRENIRLLETSITEDSEEELQALAGASSSRKRLNRQVASIACERTSKKKMCENPEHSTSDYSFTDSSLTRERRSSRRSSPTEEQSESANQEHIGFRPASKVFSDTEGTGSDSQSGSRRETRVPDPEIISVAPRTIPPSHGTATTAKDSEKDAATAADVCKEENKEAKAGHEHSCSHRIPIPEVATPSKKQQKILHPFGTHISLPTTFEQVKEATASLQSRLEVPKITQFAVDESNAEERLNLTVSKEDFSKMRVVGQFNLGFILVVKPSGPGAKHEDLFVVDQHASDEIYNFEKLQRTTYLSRQPLVVPQPLELSAVEELVVAEHLGVFENNGFSILVDSSAPPGRQCSIAAKPYSKNTVFDERDVNELIYKLREAPENVDVRSSKLRAMFAMRACRSSIMIGRPLSTRTMERVVRNLGTLNKPWNCPHGRPTLRHITSLT